MTRAQLLEQAEGLILDAEEMRDRVEANEPKRVYLAKAVIDDAVRAYVLLQTAKSTSYVETEVAVLYMRANLLTKALLSPVQ